MSKQTVVVKYGATTTPIAVLELDGQSHLDDDGEERSQLYVDEVGILRLHHDTGYQVTDVVPLQGSVVAVGTVTRTIEQEIYFPLPRDGDDDTDSGEKTLTYTPSGAISVSWDGRQGTGFGRSGRQVWVTGGYPCQATVSYPVLFTLYQFTPPAMDLEENESQQITVEAYLEAL